MMNVFCGGAAVAVTVAVAVTLASACVQQPAAQTARATADPVARSRVAINQLLALGCSQTADCATVGVGARSCGGPEFFLAYSSRDTPGPALQAAVQRHASLRKKQLEAREEMSTCELLPDPGAVCTAAGQCQLLPWQRGASGPLLR